jgi:hypothetical protein
LERKGTPSTTKETGEAMPSTGLNTGDSGNPVDKNFNNILNKNISKIVSG